MMRKDDRLRDINWDDYGISPNRYRELKYFCLQYEEKQGDESRTRDVEIIQQAARAAAAESIEDIYPYIINSIAYDLPYELIEHDKKYGRIPVGKTDFYAIRRLFYHHLNLLK